MRQETFDAIIVGSGATGGWVAKQLTEAGLKVAVYPVQSLFIAYKAVRDMMKELKTTGTIANWSQRTPTWEEFNDFIGANEATALAKRYHIV